ncbi:heterokaryon incompatibility, partial [Setomelanomma holmii]
RLCQGHYEALSYVWGLPNFEFLLALENGILLITESLNDALRRLRYPQRSRRIWVDVACINQGDSKERSAQVLRMGTTYEQAAVVVIWLG